MTDEQKQILCNYLRKLNSMATENIRSGMINISYVGGLYVAQKEFFKVLADLEIQPPKDVPLNMN